MRSFLHGLVLAGAALAAAAASAAAGCQRDADAPAIAEPYRGFTPTGYKSALERDPSWFRAVSTRRASDGGERFVLRRAGRAGGAAPVAYESIEPVGLGGRKAVFIAWRQGCADVVDERGIALGVPPFAAWRPADPSNAPSPPRTAVLQLFETGAPWSGSTWRYALFRGGALVAQSAVSYVSSYANSLPLNGALAGANEAMRIVAVKQDGGVGVVRLDTLEEVIPPAQRGIGLVVGVDHRGRSTVFWRVDDGRTQRLLHLDGRPTGISGFDDVAIVRDWGQRTWQRVVPGATVIEAIDRGAGKCRLYDEALKPLVELDLWPVSGRCPRPDNGVAAELLLANPDPALRTQVYRVALPGPTLTPLSEIDGGVVHVFQEGSMLVQRGRGAEARFRIVAPDGTALGSDEFDAYRPAGCGAIDVRRDGAWLAAYGDGVAARRTTYAFSC